MWNLLLLLFLEVLLFFIAFIFSDRDILAPSVIICVMFIISTVFALLNINTWNRIDYKIETTLIIVSGIFVFFLTENISKFVFFNYNQNNNKGTKKNLEQLKSIFVPKYYLVLLLFFNVFVIFWYYLEIKRIMSSLGFGGHNLFAAYRRMFTHLNVAFESSNVKMVNTLLSQFMKMTKGAGFICLYLLIIQIVVRKHNFRQVLKNNLLLVVNIILSICPSLMLAGRNDLIQLCAAGLVYYYIVWHRYNGWFRNISLKYVKWGIVIIIVGIPSFYGMLFLMGRKTTKSMLEYASIYLGSSIALFNDFLSKPVRGPKVFGEETFLGIHQTLYRLGIPTYVKNRHLEFRHLNSSISSNIYSFFRRPIHDFGIGGMLLFTVCVSLLFSWLYYGRIKNVYNAKNLDFRIITYGYLFYWIIYASIDQRSISMLSMTTVVTFLVIYIELEIVTKLRFTIYKKK